MKIALITDTHYGIRSDSISFMDYTKIFLEDIFFKYIDTHKISTIVHLGDLLDRRKYVNILTASRLRKDFMQPILDRKIDYHQLLGNHCTYFKTTNEISSVKELYGKNVKIYDRAQEVEFDGTKILFVPWICDDNREFSFNKIKDTDAQICFGHLELAGFEMFKGSLVSHGDSPDLFKHFDVVCTGHYHHRSSANSIHYLGSHGEFTWSDYNDPRGFHVFDTETRELTFIQNPYKMFRKIWYDDRKKMSYDLSDFYQTIIKVIVVNNNDILAFDKFIDDLEKIEPIEVQIVDDHKNHNLDNAEDIINEADSTIDIFKNYIKNLSSSVDKESLERKIIELHDEAMARD